MPRFKVKAPDGSVLEVNGPEGATEEQAIEFAKSQLAAKQSPPAPVVAQPRSGVSDFFSGVKKAGTDTVLGLKQLGAMAGMGDQAALEKEAADVKIRDADLMNTGAGMAGNVVGNIASMLVPGGALKLLGKGLPVLNSVGNALLAPKTVKGAVGLGAASGLVQPATSNENRVTNAAIGGVGGAAGNLAMQGVGRVLAPKTDAAVTALINQGVTPTPGQIMGGAPKRLEEAATSIPILGDVIRARQKGVIGEFNDAALNRSLAPINQKIASKGREAIDEAATKIGAAYDAVLPKVVLKKDANFANALTAAQANVSSLPAEQQAQFAKIIGDNITDKFTPQGFLRGTAFKESDSELGRLARGYSGDANFANRELGKAIRDAQAGLRNLLATQNPQHAKPLQAANEAWANFIRVQDAAGRVGAKEGVFTPAQLGSAVRGQDKSLRHGAYAKGEALMQDLSDSGQKVLNSSVPDSGTPYRAALGLAAGGGLAAVNPMALAGTIGASALYTPQAQKVIAALLTQRPELARGLGQAFQNASPYGAIPGAAFANSQE